MQNQLQAESAPVNDTDLIRQIHERQAAVAELPMPPRIARTMDEICERLRNIPDPPPPTPEQVEAERRADEVRSRAAIEVAEHRLAKQAGARYANCRLDTFKMTTDYQGKALGVVAEYAGTVCWRHQHCEGLVFYGPVGTGKDHLAFAVARYAVLAGLKVEWLYGQDWFGRIRDAMSDDGTSESGIIRVLTDPDFLVLSDPLPPIGPLTQHQSTMLYRAVGARYFAGKPTIVTLNVRDDAEADERIGAPTWDRLCDGAWKVFCNWPSHRKPAREVRVTK